MSETRTEPYVRGGAAVDDDASPVLAGEVSRPSPRRLRRARLQKALLALLAILAVAALVSIVWQPERRVAVPPERAAAPAPPPAEPSERYPIAATPEPVPPLDASDAAVLAALGAVFGDGTLSAYVLPDRVVRRIVVTIDNLPRATAPPSHWPVKPASGTLVTEGSSERVAIATANALRYTAYVRLLESVDAGRFIDFYRRHYPLFQQAYRELGYPNRNFNDRAVEAIDTLTATPSLPAPPRLVQPKVFLQFADRDLEALPAGQKALLRIGPENASRVKAKLAEIRSAITDPAVAAAR
jgi:hypothetical protein